MAEITLAQYIEQTTAQLKRIEQGLLAQKTVLTFDEFCKYTGISESWGYKLTSQRAVPFYCPNGKTLYFDRLEIDRWLLQNPVKTLSKLKSEAVGGRAK